MEKISYDQTRTSCHARTCYGDKELSELQENLIFWIFKEYFSSHPMGMKKSIHHKILVTRFKNMDYNRVKDDYHRVTQELWVDGRQT